MASGHPALQTQLRASNSTRFLPRIWGGLGSAGQFSLVVSYSYSQRVAGAGVIQVQLDGRFLFKVACLVPGLGWALSLSLPAPLPHDQLGFLHGMAAQMTQPQALPRAGVRRGHKGSRDPASELSELRFPHILWVKQAMKSSLGSREGVSLDSSREEPHPRTAGRADDGLGGHWLPRMELETRYK